MQSLKVLVETVLNWIAKNLPWVMVGYKLGAQGTEKVKAALRAANLKLKYGENKDAVIKENANKSSSDIIDDAINRPSSDSQKSDA